jgi:sn1-specific diacylglycerol lipase
VGYCTCRKSPTVEFQGDNCCNLHKLGLAALTSELGCSLLYANFENDTVSKPFAVYFDAAHEEIIIAVRGTLSLDDCVTDAVAAAVELVQAG